MLCLKGDVVVLDAVPGCGSDDCPECSRDLPQLCLLCQHAGIGQDGFHAPYTAIDQRGVVRIPEGNAECCPHQFSRD